MAVTPVPSLARVLPGVTPIIFALTLNIAAGWILVNVLPLLGALNVSLRIVVDIAVVLLLVVILRRLDLLHHVNDALAVTICRSSGTSARRSRQYQA